jgi:hypothetical protein
VGWVQFQEKGLNDLSGQELNVNTRWLGLDNISLEARVRQRFMDRSEDTQNVWFQGKYQTDLYEVRLQWSYEDVETLRAHEVDLQSRHYSVTSLLRLMTTLNNQADLSYQDYEDGNYRLDFRTRLMQRLSLWPDWQVGGIYARSDSRFQSSLYYTPEGLDLGRGVLSYRHRWESGWTIEAETGFGIAHDRLHGTRWVVPSYFRALQEWNSRLRSNLSWEYSHSPGYRSWTLESMLQYRF